MLGLWVWLEWVDNHAASLEEEQQKGRWYLYVVITKLIWKKAIPSLGKLTRQPSDFRNRKEKMKHRRTEFDELQQVERGK